MNYGRVPRIRSCSVERNWWERVSGLLAIAVVKHSVIQQLGTSIRKSVVETGDRFTQDAYLFFGERSEEIPLPRNKRIDAAGLDLTKLPCWFPSPTKSESLDDQPELVELSASSGSTFLENVLSCLRKQGYSDAEIDKAITEHIKARRVTLDTTGGYPIVHATDRLRCWAGSKVT